MKYIRTKDHLEELYVDEFTEYGKEYYKNSKIADTIEELCDEFVCLGSAEYQKYVKHSLKEALQKKEWLERKGYTCNIYGAIWTDKGLIYVAKMNDKGELELL